jgi:phosphatidylethanolamine-binding protein (PEBP) family uncharacterized protein
MNKIIYLTAVVLSVFFIGCGSGNRGGDLGESKSSSGLFSLYSNNFIPVHGSPDLSWSDAPDGTKSFAIVIDDHTANNYLHWAVLNIDASIDHIDSQNSPLGSIILSSQAGGRAYEDPQQRGVNEYVAHIYALDIDDVTHIEGKSIDNLVNKIYNHEEFEADFGFYILGEAEVTTVGRDLPVTNAPQRTQQTDQASQGQNQSTRED